MNFNTHLRLVCIRRVADKTKEAFDCAHSLKGILANVGLIALYDKISDIVEILRGTKDGNVEEDYRAFLKLRDECMKLLQ